MGNANPRSQQSPTPNNVIPNSSFLIERSCHTSPKLTGRPARLHKSSERTCLTPTIKALLTSAETPPLSMEGHTFHATFGSSQTYRGTQAAPLKMCGGKIEPLMPACPVHAYKPVNVDTYREGKSVCATIGNEPTKRSERSPPLCPNHTYDPYHAATLRHGMMTMGENATFSTVARVPKPQPPLNRTAFYRPVSLDLYKEVSHKGSTFGREQRYLLPIAAH